MLGTKTMIWLIGGAARCGKSTLTHKAQSVLGSPVVPLDFLTRALIPIATEANQASLRLSTKIDDHTIPTWLDALRERDRVLWRVTEDLIGTALKSKTDLMLEGAIWPDYAAGLVANENIRTVFLVDTSDQHIERTRHFARSQETNWLSDWSDERIAKWARYNIARSQTIYYLAMEHGQPVFDVGIDGFVGVQRKALRYLSGIK